MKIAFFEYFLNIRGTSAAIYDYAHYNEQLLHNESIVITQDPRLATHEDACAKVYDKFHKRFPVFYIQGNDTMFHDIQTIVDREKPDVLYILWKSDIHHLFKRVKTFVHCVFDPRNPYGDSFCVISEWLNLAFQTNYPVIPHIVTRHEENTHLREELGIPMDATVFGRYGGLREFDHPAGQEAVVRLSTTQPHIYFLFMNTAAFLTDPSPNVLFLDKSTDPRYKARFINTCDAMLYARTRGETFGLSIAEFSIRNKPIFAPRDAPEQNHRLVLQENAYWYTDTDNLCQQILAFRPQDARKRDWNMYRAFSPERVMASFQHQLTILMRPPRVCYVTTFLSADAKPLILDAFLNDEEASSDLVVFADRTLSHHLSRMLPSNVLVEEIDAAYLQDHSVIWRRLEREEAIVESPEFKAIVQHRKTTLVARETIIKHAKIDFIQRATSLVPHATHLAWIDPEHTARLTQIDHDAVTYDIATDIHPAIDGQVLYTLQKAPDKIRGSFFYGSKSALLQYQSMYHHMHQTLQDRNVVVDDQAMALFCYLQKPDLFHFHLESITTCDKS